MESIWGLPTIAVVILGVLAVIVYIFVGVAVACVHELIIRWSTSDSFTNSWLYRFWNSMFTHHRNRFNRLHVAFWPLIVASGLVWLVGIFPLKSLYRFLNPEKFFEKKPKPTPVAEVTRIDPKKKRRRAKRAG